MNDHVYDGKRRDQTLSYVSSAHVRCCMWGTLGLEAFNSSVFVLYIACLNRLILVSRVLIAIYQCVCSRLVYLQSQEVIVVSN